ncbi:MAG TPA: hypothetical protein VFH80_17520 [Solirubrobacteraceae bacterium]|nr:hypothetical protein [Solirubrobacteraceae bacterium]
MIALIIASVWLFGPVIVLGAVIAIGEWHDRRQWHRDEQRLALFIGLEQSWDLPPAERRRPWN